MRTLALGALSWLCISVNAQALAVPVLVVAQPQVSTIISWSSFSLTTLGSSVKAHWDANDLAVSPVATWTDNVSSVAVTATGSAQPTWSTTAFIKPIGNPKAGVSCDGVANALVNTSFAALPSGSTPGEVWVLADQQDPTTGSTAVIIRYGNSTTDTGRQIQRGLSGQFVVSTGNGATSVNQLWRQSFIGPSLMWGAWSTTSITGRFDGSETKPISSTISTLNTSTTRLRICANNTTSATNFLHGVISDVIITTTLTNTQRYQLEGWLAWRGGIQIKLPYNHPFRFRQP